MGKNAFELVELGKGKSVLSPCLGQQNGKKRGKNGRNLTKWGAILAKIRAILTGIGAILIKIGTFLTKNGAIFVSNGAILIKTVVIWVRKMKFKWSLLTSSPTSVLWSSPECAIPERKTMG